MVDEPGTADARPHGTTRRRIIAAAMAVMSERGMAAASMSAIAERAGISRMTLYRHFPDVDHIMAAIVEEEFATFREALDAELDERMDALEQLRVLIDAHLRQYASEPERFGDGAVEAGFSPVVRDAVQRELGEHHRRLVAILRRGIAEGSLRTDLDPELHAELLQHLLGGLRHTVLRHPDRVDGLADEVTALVLDGLTRRASPSP